MNAGGIFETSQSKFNLQRQNNKNTNPIPIYL